MRYEEAEASVDSKDEGSKRQVRGSRGLRTRDKERTSKRLRTSKRPRTEGNTRQSETERG